MKRVYCILIISLIFNAGCSSLLFFPQRKLLENPFLKQVSYEDIYFKTSDDLLLHGWYLKAKDKTKGTILYLHGNAENISTHVNNVLWLTLEGYDIFAFDYRGYGKSEGSPTLDGIHIDAHAALETVLTLPQTNKERLFVFGQSLGGAVAVYAVATSAYKDRIKAVIIDSTFSGYRRIAREKFSQLIITWPFQYPLSFLFNDYFSPVRWVKEVSPVPLLIIHGDKDSIVPIHHGSLLHEAALSPKEFWLVKGVGHTQAFALKEIREKFLRYLQKT